MSAASSRPDDRGTAAPTFAKAAQIAAKSLEGCWPDSSAIVIWRAAGGADAINDGALIHLGRHDSTNEPDLLDSLADLVGTNATGLGSAHEPHPDPMTSAVTVPLLVDGRREGLICVLGISDPRHRRGHELLGGIAGLLATVRHWELQHERVRDEAGTLRREARTDPLTGLLNRRGFLPELDAHWSHGKDPDFGDVLLLADIRGLKAANDRYGHTVGDQLLIDVSDALRATILPQDVIGRFGGDEFAVILCGQAATARATRYATDVQHELAQRAAGRPTSLAVRFGAQPLASVQSAAHALELADNAMFRR